MSEATALAVLEKPLEGETPSALMRRATDVAGVCREIVMRTAMDLKGKKYVKVEGWMSIAAAYGCVPSIREVVEEERGIKAVAELRRHDGQVLASAEGYVGLDEPRWAKEPLYSRRGMAQTRAISRVCRSVFAFCVVLIDANLQTTPAEEIPASGGGDVVDVLPVSRPRAANAAPCPHDKSTKVKFGKSKKDRSELKGKCLCEIEDADLDYQVISAKKSVEANDPKWGESNRRWLETVFAEVARRAFPEATGQRAAPVAASPRQASLPVATDEGEELVTPLQAMWRLGREHGKEPKSIVQFALGAIGKATSFTHEDVEKVRAALGPVSKR